MYPELHNYDRELTLVMNSGIQFVDFGLNIDWKDKVWREKGMGNFMNHENMPLQRLILSRTGEGYCHPAQPNRIIQNPDHEISMEQSCKLFNGVWLPIPVLRTLPPDSFDEGPYNWARARIIKLESPDIDGNTHRITVAFDTKIFANNANTAYLAPTEEDVRAGSDFALASQSHQMSWFLDFKWVNEWLLELFKELAPEPTRLKIHPDDLDLEIKDKLYQGHYLNILALLGDEIKFPKIKIISNRNDDISKPIAVDLVLDVGNSRTCGILIEEHSQESDGLRNRYELEIRDLSRPEEIYNEPFESRVEFSQAFFGKEHWSVQSGRRDAFQWVTIARIGKEANRLASLRQGNEGATGLSSPKRYLWDEDQYEQGWRFNSSYVKTDVEPHATAEPLSGLINEYGEPLHILSDDIDEEFERKMPVFQPKYSRQSLMTFMLSEVLMQALMQINSPAQRYKLAHAKSPRYLRNIILTIPPAMPKPERAIFRKTMHNAIGLVWKSLGWDNTEDPIDLNTREGREKYWPYLPEVHIQWDEATCGQVVYLYNETQKNYAGRPEEFIRTMARPDKSRKDVLTIASIDVGGGTTDLVINDYHLDYGENGNLSSSNTFIVPTQRFRDGFKVAGDDILLDVIRNIVVKALEDGVKRQGIKNPDVILADLLGSATKMNIQDELLRQQLTLQIFTPVGLRILKEYESYDPYTSPDVVSGATFGSLLSETEKPTENVLNYINIPVQRETGNEQFNILDLPIQVNLKQIHSLFLQGRFDICKTFDSLSEIVNLYQCDVLLLTGRPSRLPGVQAFFKSRLSLPVGRILPLHNYHTGGWYPFHKLGCIDDPKTTAAVGAMICVLSTAGRLSNFYFRATAMTAYSTVKYIGLLDNNNVLKQGNVYYSELELDNPDAEFPDHEFEVRGSARLGFRQLNVERWNASPIYLLTILDPNLKARINNDGAVLKVSIGPKKLRGIQGANGKEKENTEEFEIKSMSVSDGRSINKNQVRLRLNTLLEAGLSGGDQYWLDSGVIKR